MYKFGSLVLGFAMLGASCGPAAKKASSEVKIVDKSNVDLNLTAPGTFSFQESEYSSKAAYDPDVVRIEDKVDTDFRGRLFMPKGPGPFPLVVFLHGNHATCGIVLGNGNPRIDFYQDFTFTGACGKGDIEVPSYRGYDDSARLLASWGFAVVSINANRGITGNDSTSDFDGNLVYARGKLVLRHLEELAKWSRDGKSDVLTFDDPTLTANFDMSRVGVMGHSRGGEGVRYAYNIYTSPETGPIWQKRIPGLKFGGVFEVGPVDVGATDETKIEAKGVAWNVIIPGCDHDVSDFAGVRPFTRMLANMKDDTPKSVFVVWGANHNYFNTEWQTSDAETCSGAQVPLFDSKAPILEEAQAFDTIAHEKVVGSSQQIEIEKSLLLAFFQANLAGRKDLGHVFDTQYALPKQLDALAPSSRLYVVAAESKLIFNPAEAKSTKVPGGVSILTLADQIDAAFEAISKTNKERGGNRVEFRSAPNIPPAMAFEASVDAPQRTALLPFAKEEATQGFWTIDLSMALRKPCATTNNYFRLECPVADLDNAFEVALVLADGTRTNKVKIQDYVKMQNWSADSLVPSYGSYKNGEHFDTYIFIPALYQTARMELTDFKVTNQMIKGIELTFSPNADVSLLLESVRLTKRPE